MDQLPFLLPNCQSLNQQPINYKQDHHRCQPSSMIDMAGSGSFFKDYHLHRNRPSEFASLKPTLPFVVNHTGDTNTRVTQNCLAYHQGRHAIVAGFNQRLSLVKIEENDRFLDEFRDADSRVFKSHQLAVDKSLDRHPFVCRSLAIDVLSDAGEAEDNDFIIDLGWCNDNLAVMSRNNVEVWRWNEDQLEMVNRIAASDLQDVEDGVLFDRVDLNPFLPQEALAMFKLTQRVFNIDLETRQVLYEEAPEFVQDKTWCRGLVASRCHPRQALVARKDRVSVVDTRSKNPTQQIFVASECIGLDKWEQFWAIHENELNDYQVFVASDQHLLVGDIRYPGQSLNQSSHMLPNSMPQLLSSSKLSLESEPDSLVLVASNLTRSAAYIFNRKEPCVNPLSSQFPMHLSTPKDTFLMHGPSNYRFIGSSVIPLDHISGFTIVSMIDAGHLYNQDFFVCNDLEEKVWAKGIGLLDTEFTDDVRPYVEQVDDYLMSILKDPGLRLPKSCNKFKGCCVCLKKPEEWRRAGTSKSTQEASQSAETEEMDQEVDERIDVNTLVVDSSGRISRNKPNYQSKQIEIEVNELVARRGDEEYLNERRFSHFSTDLISIWRQFLNDGQLPDRQPNA